MRSVVTSIPSICGLLVSTKIPTASGRTCNDKDDGIIILRFFSVQLGLFVILFFVSKSLFISQQHPPPPCFAGVLVIFTLLFCPVTDAAGGPILFFISAAIVMKACSTFVAFFALVSRNGTASWSANSCGKTMAKQGKLYLLLKWWINYSWPY